MALERNQSGYQALTPEGIDYTSLNKLLHRLDKTAHCMITGPVLTSNQPLLDCLY